MVTSFSVSTPRSDVQEEEYRKRLEELDLLDVVKEFLSYLDYTEETDSGTEFHPITIGSCRVLMTRPLSMCLEKLRERVKIGY